MKKEAELIVKILDELFPNPAIPLTHNSNYTLLIAVLLSAQCTDDRVNQVTPKLFEKGQTPKDICKFSLHEIEEIIKSCGLYKAKAKAILNLSKILVEKYKGKVPKTFKELEELPGVGHKTASVIMAQCFNVPSFPVDTHIHRLAKRWGLSNGKNVLQTEKDLKKTFPKSLWNKLHLQFIYYGRAYCKARGHEILKCPICSNMSKSS